MADVAVPNFQEYERVERKRPKPIVPLVDACQDPLIFGPWFQPKDQWIAWFSFLKTLENSKLSNDEKSIYEECTQREYEHRAKADPFEEIWMVCGRRAGKTRMMALLAVYLACFYDWTPFLAPGERGTVALLAADRKQARTAFRYVHGFLDNVGLLNGYVERSTAEAFDLKNQVTIEIQTASFRSIRGYTLVAALLDEVAFWRNEDSSNPDEEILEALRPGMASIPGSLLVAASSPYARQGVLYETWKEDFGTDNPEILVWQAPTLVMNKALNPNVVKRAYARDPYRATAEYGANFRTDVETFVTREVMEACTDKGEHERKYRPKFQYRAFVDPSGGASDGMTLAIAHAEDDMCVLDLVREYLPPFSPEEVVKEYSEILKRYNVFQVRGDRYGGEWPRERFSKEGIYYEVSPDSKSEIYRACLPILNSQQARLIEHDKMFNQFVSLERRARVGARESIDHPPKGHDDISNSVAGVLVSLDIHGIVDLW